MADVRVDRAGSSGAWVWRALLTAVAALVLVAGWLEPPIWVILTVVAFFLVAVTLRYPIAGLCLLAFSVPWGGGFPLGVGGVPLTSTELVTGALGVAWVVSGVSVHRWPVGTRLWLPYLGLFLATITVSASQAIDVHASMREILKWTEMIVVYLSASWFVRTRRDMAAVVAALVLAGVSQALLGFVQLAFDLGPAAFVRIGLLRAYGTFDQPNPFAGYLNIVFPLALVMGIMGAPRAQRPLYRLATFLIAGGVLASGSRGALLAALVANAIVLGYLSWRLRFLAWTGVLAGAVGGLAAAFGLVPSGPFEKVLGAIGLGNVSFGNVTNANFSAVERAAHWLAGMRMFAAHPLLGVGIGNYATAYPAYHPRGWYAALEHAHNYYINVAAEAGIFGLLTYVLMIGSAAWYSYSVLSRSQDRLFRAVALASLGALVATSFHNLFDVLYVHGMAALLGLLVAFVAVSVRMHQQSAVVGESGSYQAGI